MSLFKESEKKVAAAIAALNYTNPFTPERIELEKLILGGDYHEKGMVWSASSQDSGNSNLANIISVVKNLAFALRRRLDDIKIQVAKRELETYENIVIYYLFEKYRSGMTELIFHSGKTPACHIYDEFLVDFNHFLSIKGYEFSRRHEPRKTFEIYFQVHRAFYYIFEFIIGSSEASARLRSSIWQSIFTHDIYRYNRALYDKMQNITTLITGPSGTGKELVARAIALSQYIPFNPREKCFAVPFHEQFHPLHLSAMPQTLIESELFGHCKGAFTGAVHDRKGRMETCSEFGTVFLDEIGEISEEVQVKLLRLLQNRSFQRLGEHRERCFKGKILAATNRDLQEQIGNRKFRLDLYYRLCSDVIATPSLQEMLNGSETELATFTRFIARKILGQDEGECLADEAIAWIVKNLGLDYDWPGNVRELEQCIRNILIRGGYVAATAEPARNPGDALFQWAQERRMTADELLNHYCAALYLDNQSYSRTAEILQLDRRTVRKRVLEAEIALDGERAPDYRLIPESKR